jgi:dipeptidyl aminopeptidase/acylaminoacyl peptidase
MAIRRIIATLVFVLAGSSASAQADPLAHLDGRTDAAIRAAVERQRVIGDRATPPQFDVSRDGARMVVAIQSPDIAANRNPVDLWLVEPGSGAPPRVLLRVADHFRTSINPMLDAAGRRVAFIGERDSGTTAPAILNIATGTVAWLGASLPDGGATASAVSWSPDARRLAVLFTQRDATPIMHGVAVDIDWTGRLTPAPAGRLAILDAETGRILGMTPATLSLDGRGAVFSWSPDGGRIAFSAHPVAAENMNRRGTDIYMIDTRTFHVDNVVSRPGLDSDPLWSADGGRLAFLSSGGVASLRGPYQLSILDIRSGRESRLVAPDGASPYGYQWLDADRLVFAAALRMGCQIFVGQVSSFRVRQFSLDDLSCLGALRTAGDNNLYALRSSFAHPAELIRTAMRRWDPRTVFPFSRQAPSIGRQRVVDWAVPGNPERVHGVVVEPLDRAVHPRPLLVVLVGGPNMVSADAYNDDAQQLVLPALLRGYAVFIPNTRGRGGYGLRFARLIRDTGSVMVGPFDDAVAGIDRLVEDGVADPSRLALAGFSYGGVLAQYSATRTQRFRAIMAFEGAVDVYMRVRESYGGPEQERARELFGFSDPYDPRERALMIDQSPIDGAGNVRTPILLECGAENLAPTDCVRFFRAVRQRTGTPIELIVYPRTGHSIVEPALRYDSAQRQASWLDRWMGGPN